MGCLIIAPPCDKRKLIMNKGTLEAMGLPGKSDQFIGFWGRLPGPGSSVLSYRGVMVESAGTVYRPSTMKLKKVQFECAKYTRM